MLLLFLLLPIKWSLGYTEYSYHPVLRKDSTYNKLASPYDVTREIMTIIVDTTLVVLVDVVEDIQTTVYIGSLNYTWTDPRLAFDPKELGMDYAVVPAHMIWIPWVNCWSCTAVTRFDTLTDSDDAIIQPDGRVTTMIRARFDTVCACQVEAFPFDIQYCGWNFDGGWAGDDRQRIVPNFAKNKTYLISSPEWEMEWYTTLVGDSNFGFKNLYKLTRNVQYYVCFMILPTFAITSVCVATILLPSHLSSGDKMSMGINGFLGLTFLLSIIVTQVPRSAKLPLIGTWLLIEMGFLLLAMAIVSPIKKLKKKITPKKEPSFLTDYGVDLFFFTLIFALHLFISLWLYLFPGAQTGPPLADHHF